MPAPTTIPEFVGLVQKSGVLDAAKLAAYLDRLRAGAALPPEPTKLAGLMVRDGLITHFQAEQFLQGRWKRFSIGKYKVLERIGSGGMGQVFLCEHKIMRRRVAVKVLPTVKAEDPSSLQRFYREARAVAALDHPNVVRAYDIDQDEKLHFLVMEYVDGRSMQEIVKAAGPMDVPHAAHYIRQAAVGLQYSSDVAGLVHRDIKPGNVLIDRFGVVKILDMGLARFFHDVEDNLTRMNDEQVLGTADYLAPEQAVESHSVDIRADIYSLGATFYFLLTGQPPFAEGTITQKLIWHQKRPPRPIREFRTDVPDGVLAVIDKMMAKDPEQRYQRPAEVAEALEPWTTEPIDLPPPEWMPNLSLAAQGAGGPRPPDANGQAGPTSIGGPSTVPSGPRTPPPATLPYKPRPTPKSPRPAPSTPPPPTPPEAIAPVSPPPPKHSSVVELTTPPEPAGDEPARIWEKLIEETPRPVPADTAESPATAASRSSKVRKKQPAGRRQHRWLPVVAVAVALVAVALGVGVWLWLRGGFGPRASEQKVVSPRTLVVNDSGRPETFKTIFQAYVNARPGDRIVVTDEIHKETLTLDRLSAQKDVTISPPAGKRVTWKPSPAAQRRLIELRGCDGLHLSHFDFDGQGLETIIYAAGHCEGLTLEDVTLQGHSGSAVRLVDCEGSANRPVILDHVRVLRSKAAGAKPAAVSPVEALALSSAAGAVLGPGPGCQFIVVKDCELEGVDAAVRFEGAFGDVTLTGCQLGPAQTGLLFEALDPPAKSQKKPTLGPLTVNNNRFVSVEFLARVDADRSFEFDSHNPSPVKSSGNLAPDKAKQGNLRIE